MTNMQAMNSRDIAPLFSPFRLKKITLPNRFVMCPMTRSFSPGGIPGDGVAAYYRRRAQGGVGLILTEGVGIPHPSAIGFSGVDVLSIPSMYGADALDKWRGVVDEVHKAGGLIAPQLWHQGGMRLPGTGAWPSAESMRPSGIWGPTGRPASVKADYIGQVSAPTRPMSESDIADVISAYGAAAANAKSVGFDAIAIHGAHGYLIDSFLWQETNVRADRWGGSLAARASFAAEIVREIRRAVGGDMPIILRISQWKQQDLEGRIADTPAELEILLAPVVEAGVDVFDVSERYFGRPAFEGADRSLAGWVRQVTGCATIAVGSIGLEKSLVESHQTDGARVRNNLDELVRRFENDEFDLAGVGRMLIVHPDWVERVRQGLPMRPYDKSLLADLY